MKKLMRSRVGIGAAAAIGLCFMAMSATAQVVDRSKDRPDTVKVWVSGTVDYDMVYRSSEVTFFTTSVAPGIGSDGETTYEGYVAMRFMAELSDKVSGTVEVGTRRMDNSLNNYFGGGNNITVAPGGTSQSAQSLSVREAHIMLGDFLTPDLSAQLGISTWSFDIRGKGTPFAFDMRRSQSIVRNIDIGGNLVSEDLGAARLGAAATPDELDPVGATLVWKRDRLQLDIVALPGVLEGGTASADEALYAVDFLYTLDDKSGSRIGAILALHSIDRVPLGIAGGGLNTETQFFTLGGGGSIKMDGGIELFAEAYTQFGDAGQVLVAGQEETIEMGGMAFQLGGVYTLPNSSTWVGVTYVSISGDGDAVIDGDDTVDRFSAYEGVGDALILENMYYGFDVDSNYNALKISGGMSFDMGGKQQNLHVSVFYGHFTANEEIEFGGAVGGEDALGDEVDVRVKWDLTKQASLTAAIGFLFGSDVLEESMGGAAAEDSEDSATLFSLGANLNF